MKVQFINCTPHAVTVMNDNNEVILSLPKSGLIPRLSQTTQLRYILRNIPITETVFGQTVDLPNPEPYTFLIVSRLVLEANKDREDLLVPNDIVRDESGNIIGCRSFAIN